MLEKKSGISEFNTDCDNVFRNSATLANSQFDTFHSYLNSWCIFLNSWCCMQFRPDCGVTTRSNKLISLGPFFVVQEP